MTLKFAYIASMRVTFEDTGPPVVNIDAKHRELVGDFKHYRATWEQEPILVLDHDFPFDATGVALLNGVSVNEACVFVTTTSDTPDFAVEKLARW